MSETKAGFISKTSNMELLNDLIAGPVKNKKQK
jgi:hypothetical protein